MIRAVLISILKRRHRVEGLGSENYAKAGKRPVIVVDHVSYLDAVPGADGLPGG